MDKSAYFLIIFIVRVVITFYCIDKAGKLNRSKGGWGIFGFIFPIIALIWIQSIKPITIWDDDKSE